MSEDLPDSTFSGKNLRDFVKLVEVEIDNYSVVEWVPGDNGEGVPEAVCINFNLGGALDGATFMIRLKSRKSVQTLIKALERHRDSVWPR